MQKDCFPPLAESKGADYTPKTTRRPIVSVPEVAGGHDNARNPQIEPRHIRFVISPPLGALTRMPLIAGHFA